MVGNTIPDIIVEMITSGGHTLFKNYVFRTKTSGGRIITFYEYWNMFSGDESETTYCCADLGAIKKTFCLRVKTLNTS